MGIVTLRRAGASKLPAGAALAGFVLAVGCSGPREAAGLGHSCYRTADCREGLLCIDSYCSSDLERRVPTDDIGPPAPPAPTDAGMDAPADGSGGSSAGGAGAAGGSSGAGASGGGAAAGAAGGGAGGAGGGVGGAGTGGGGGSANTDAGPAPITDGG